MTYSISSAFDGGNIRLVAIEGDRIDLEIVKDQSSDFYQWFYFRLTGAGGKAVEMRLLNCAGSAYPNGWDKYRLFRALHDGAASRPRRLGRRLSRRRI